MNLRVLEGRLRELLEVRLIRAIPGRRPEDQLVRQLTQAMHAHVRIQTGGIRVAPNIYTLLVAPSSLARWQSASLTDTMIQIIKAVGAEAGLQFRQSPTITLGQDTTLRAEETRVVASHSTESIARTQDMPVEPEAKLQAEEAGSIPTNAFLIVDGVKEFSLTRPVVNLGRRLDNDLVIDDPRVSRHHAQLRAIKNRYVLFDLNSSGGTFINGQRTSQTVLYPGDVISLAGVSLIFGQDIPLPQRDLGHTGPRSKVGAERPTAIIRPPTHGLRKKE